MGCPPEQLAEIHSSGTQDGIYHIPFSSFEAVTVHSVFPLEMPNAWLNRCTSFHPAPEASGCSASCGLIDMNFRISLCNCVHDSLCQQTHGAVLLRCALPDPGCLPAYGHRKDYHERPWHRQTNRHGWWPRHLPCSRTHNVCEPFPC